MQLPLLWAVDAGAGFSDLVVDQAVLGDQVGRVAGKECHSGEEEVAAEYFSLVDSADLERTGFEGTSWIALPTPRLTRGPTH